MNTDTNPVANLIQLITVARDAGQYDLACWLQDGVDDYLFHNIELERALNLHAQSGKRKAKTIYMTARRDSALRDAFSHIEEKNTYRRILALKNQLSDFEARIWPRYLNHEEPPPRWSNLQKSLFTAMKSGCTMPTSTSQFYIVLNV